MRKAGLIAGAVAAVAGVSLWATAQVSAQGSARTVWDGIYTEAQATAGAHEYADNCSFCHGVQLEGTGEAPGLSGPVFTSTYNGLSVGDLFDRIRTTMPMDRPGGLSRQAYAEITAYLLKSNGFPAGQAELSQRSEMLATIPFTTQRPAGATSAAPAAAQPAAASEQQAAPAVSSGAVASGAVASGAVSSGAGAVPASSITGPNTPNSQPNPYNVDYHFFKLPPGRVMGSSSAVAVDSRGHIWVVDRCGANSCAKSDLDPVMEFDAEGNFVKAFGKGVFIFPHGFYIDSNDHLWITDGFVDKETSRGAQVIEFDTDGKELRRLGKAGVQGQGPDEFWSPNAVLVTKEGTIFVADGHNANDPVARVMKFSADGRFVEQWGTPGAGQGQLQVPHALAIDSEGRLYVGDRWNNRVQVYDQDGNLLGSMQQFGRPSGLFIDKNDILYSADSESREPRGYGHNPGWKRGIRIGSVKDGIVREFIVDTHPNPDAFATSNAEGIWADDNGVIYGAQVNERTVARYTKK